MINQMHQAAEAGDTGRLVYLLQELRWKISDEVAWEESKVAGRIMPDMFDHASLDRWRSDPVSFIEEMLIDPETDEPFVLLPAESAFLQHAFKTDEDGRMLYPELLYACPKKSGKTAFAAIITIDDDLAVRRLLIRGGVLRQRPRSSTRPCVCCGQAHRRGQPAVEVRGSRSRKTRSPSRRRARPSRAIDSGYAGAAGGNQNISVFDEVWAYTSERSRRLWDELVPPPTRKIACRLCVTYAGFEGESVLLQEMYKRGLQQEQIGTDLYGWRWLVDVLDA